ncbi:hypothetical protein FA15DRAFT_711139 [Coprinopsis marcescibilis]|uniref:Uncharacterized protein n=1 Tax=Coprinopsis marcescibilis TaxID=230819 RepID=A0A5C3KBG8_COPMA|nr:hypothetical protein FA15DRAFT_711139 [Coprinopsis marcescibilis]
MEAIIRDTDITPSPRRNGVPYSDLLPRSRQPSVKLRSSDESIGSMPSSLSNTLTFSDATTSTDNSDMPPTPPDYPLDLPPDRQGQKYAMSTSLFVSIDGLNTTKDMARVRGGPWPSECNARTLDPLFDDHTFRAGQPLNNPDWAQRPDAEIGSILYNQDTAQPRPRLAGSLLPLTVCNINSHSADISNDADIDIALDSLSKDDISNTMQIYAQYASQKDTAQHLHEIGDQQLSRIQQEHQPKILVGEKLIQRARKQWSPQDPRRTHVLLFHLEMQKGVEKRRHQLTEKWLNEALDKPTGGATSSTPGLPAIAIGTIDLSLAAAPFSTIHSVSPSRSASSPFEACL